MNADQQAHVGPWRDGKYLVTTEATTLPRRCLRCNAPTDRIEQLTLRWQPPRGASGLISGVLFLLSTQFVYLKPPRCRRCKQWIRPRFISTLFGFLGLGAMLCILLVDIKGEKMAAVTLVSVAGGCLLIAGVAAVWPSDTRVVEIAGDSVWVTGFCAAYLSNLKPYPSVGLPQRMSAGLPDMYPVRYLFLLFAILTLPAIGVFLSEWFKNLDVRNDEVVTGEVIESTPTQRYGFAKALDHRIRLEDATEVHAIAGGTGPLVGSMVQFRYDGNPTKEVFLFEVEDDPLWILLAFVFAGMTCLIVFLAWRKPVGGHAATST